MCTFVLDNDEIKTYCRNEDGFLLFWAADGCLIREKVVTFRMVKLNLLLSIFLITK